MKHSCAWTLPIWMHGETGSILIGKIHAELYRTWRRSMFHWLWRPRKHISIRRNCISISYQSIIITTFGFEVVMLPDRENSCRTTQNLTSVDVPLTLASSKTYRPRNCMSISYRRIVITTSGFVVAMLPDRENSCRTIQNFMSVDIPLTLASLIFSYERSYFA